MPKDIIDGRVSTASIARVSPEHVERLARHKLKAGDIVYGRRGDIGRQALVRQEQVGWLCGTGCLRISLGNTVLDPLFLHYYLRQQSVIGWIANQAIGATMPNLNTGILRSVPVKSPPLWIQRRIAGILSAYDDLFENNLRRIRILEEMARALYREWFVEFRFPGHKNARRVSSSLGPIPEGWQVKPVAESFEILGGGTPSREESGFWQHGDIQWFSPRDLTAAGTMFMDDSTDHINPVGLKHSSARLFPPFSVMLTSRATIGAIAINTQPATTNQGFITCLPNARVPLYFLYQWLKDNVPLFERLASGATFKEISRGVFTTIEFLIPADALAHRYQSVVDPIADQLLNLQRRNDSLRRTRDLLLPRLLSGQIALRETAA